MLVPRQACSVSAELMIWREDRLVRRYLPIAMSAFCGNTKDDEVAEDCGESCTCPVRNSIGRGDREAENGVLCVPGRPCGVNSWCVRR